MSKKKSAEKLIATIPGQVVEARNHQYGLHFALRALHAVLSFDLILMEHSEQIASDAPTESAAHEALVHEYGRLGAKQLLDYALNHFEALINSSIVTTTTLTLMMNYLEHIERSLEKDGYTYRDRRAAAASAKAALDVWATAVSATLPQEWTIDVGTEVHKIVEAFKQPKPSHPEAGTKAPGGNYTYRDMLLALQEEVAARHQKLVDSGRPG